MCLQHTWYLIQCTGGWFKLFAAVFLRIRSLSPCFELDPDCLRTCSLNDIYFVRVLSQMLRGLFVLDILDLRGVQIACESSKKYICQQFGRGTYSRTRLHIFMVLTRKNGVDTHLVVASF